MPERVQLSRAKGWRMPENTVKVDRTTRWWNQAAKVGEDISHYTAGCTSATNADVVDLFRRFMDAHMAANPAAFEEWIAPCAERISPAGANRVWLAMPMCFWNWQTNETPTPALLLPEAQGRLLPAAGLGAGAEVCRAGKTDQPRHRGAEKERVMKAWKDITGYSRDDKARTPTTWEARSGPIRLVVTKSHKDYPNRWIMHGHGIGIDTLDMCLPVDVELEVVQRQAIDRALRKSANISDALQDLLE